MLWGRESLNGNVGHVSGKTNDDNGVPGMAATTLVGGGAVTKEAPRLRPSVEDRAGFGRAAGPRGEAGLERAAKAVAPSTAVLSPAGRTNSLNSSSPTTIWHLPGRGRLLP